MWTTTADGTRLRDVDNKDDNEAQRRTRRDLDNEEERDIDDYKI
jgi:hypothetical protein